MMLTAIRSSQELGGEYLKPSEVKETTGGESKLQEQVRVLTEQGVPFKVVGKRVLVSRYHVREWLAGRLSVPSRGGVNLDLVKR